MRPPWSLGAWVLAAAAMSCRPAGPAPSGSTLLFLRRSPAATVAGTSWAADPDNSRLVGFDGRLRVARFITNPRLALPVAVATLGDRLLVTELTGEGLLLDTAGTVVREWESPAPLPVALYAGGGEVIVAARSPYRVPGLSNESAGAPLLRVLDTLGRAVAGIGTIRQVPFLAQVVNAGAVAVDADGAAYFAPLVRDEIHKYRRDGTLAWTTKRGLYPVETDPVYLPAVGREIPIRQALVNVALALGPDGRLYALGAEDSAATRLRLDVLDPASGAIQSTRSLAPEQTAIALGPGGRLEFYDAATLLAGTATDRREPFAPAFALPDLAGDTVPLARFAGRVTLVNFWASWCDPCRLEFPYMAELYRDFDRGDFAIAAISDDVDGGKMRGFVREFGPPFPILVGGGRMKNVYHYRGLPYSVLLDRRGRIVERIFGFGGASEFTRLRATIAKEIAAP